MTLQEFFGSRLVRKDNAYFLDGEECVLKNEESGIVTGEFKNGTPIYAMNQFGHLEVSYDFEHCDDRMSQWESDHCDMDSLVESFYEKHDKGKNYALSDYWSWYRRMTVACFYGRWKFFEDNGLEMNREEGPLWFLHLVYENADKPFNDFCGIISKLIKRYEEET